MRKRQPQITKERLPRFKQVEKLQRGVETSKNQKIM